MVLRSIYQVLLPLSHKSGRLCLYEPLPVPDLVFDVFFDFFAVCLARTTKKKLQHAVEPCGRTAAKKNSWPKNSRIPPLSQGGGKKCWGKSYQKYLKNEWTKWGTF